MSDQETFKDSRYKVPNLERALVMMEHLLDHPHGRSASELSDDLGFSKNSVFRITMTLLHHRYRSTDAHPLRRPLQSHPRLPPHQRASHHHQKRPIQTL